MAEKDEKKEKEKKDDGGLLYLIIPLIIIVPFVLIIFVIMAMHSIRNRKVGSEGKTQQLKQASRAPEPQPKHYPPQAKPVNPNIQGRMKQQKD